MGRFCRVGLSIAILMSAGTIGRSRDDPPGEVADAAQTERHELRYRFAPDETVRWNVEHRARVTTTVLGNTQTAETLSKSIKVWRVVEVTPDGQTTFEHRVDSVDMRQNVTGREEVRYNSLADAAPPPGFEQAAQSVGVALATITIDARGKVLVRRGSAAALADGERQITVPLPEEAIAVGESWSFPYEIDIRLPSKEVKKISTRQRFTLDEVAGGVATIAVVTQILTPVSDPAIEAQLVQRTSQGKVRFDIAAGRVIDQQMDVDKQVVNFNGEGSSMHYVARFQELLLANEVDRAAKPAPRKTVQTPTTPGPDRRAARTNKPGTRRR